jgi:tetratricopeptide (TPR) repeat protein
VKEILREEFRWKLNLLLFIPILILGPVFSNLYSVSGQGKPSRQSSIETFDSGNYEKAYGEFSELLKLYSKDPLYKYYSGVCLVKLGRNPQDAAGLLSQALKGAAIVKTLPPDALFFLGRAQQMSGNFAEAADSYRQFSDEAGKKVSKDLGVADFIKQCENGEGATPVIVPEKPVEKVVPKVIEPEPKVNQKPEVKVNKNNTSSLPVNYDKLLDEALVLQYKSDSVNSVVADMKQKLVLLPPDEKAVYRAKISETETLALNLQNSADKKYDQAQAAISSPTEITQVKDEVVKTDKAIAVVPPVTEKTVPVPTHEPDSQKITKADTQIDTKAETTPVVQSNQATTVCFEVVRLSGNDELPKIPVNGEVPEGLIYRIQVAVFRNPVTASYFKGITPVFGFRVSGTDKTNYYAGMFRKSADAGKALLEVRSKGFKDAFTVAFFGNKPVSADRAVLLEKEWGGIPFSGYSSEGKLTPADTIAPELVFRVEVTRGMKPLKADAEEAVRKLAGTRGLDVQNRNDGTIVYLIGKFITFESAAEYADLLIRNGYREAKVVAFTGRREIPVETAKQLFEKIE